MTVLLTTFFAIYFLCCAASAGKPTSIYVNLQYSNPFVHGMDPPCGVPAPVGFWAFKLEKLKDSNLNRIHFGSEADPFCVLATDDYETLMMTGSGAVCPGQSSSWGTFIPSYKCPQSCDDDEMFLLKNEQFSKSTTNNYKGGDIVMKTTKGVQLKSLHHIKMPSGCDLNDVAAYSNKTESCPSCHDTLNPASSCRPACRGQLEFYLSFTTETSEPSPFPGPPSPSPVPSPSPSPSPSSSDDTYETCILPRAWCETTGVCHDSKNEAVAAHCKYTKTHTESLGGFDIGSVIVFFGILFLVFVAGQYIVRMYRERNLTQEAGQPFLAT